MSTGTMTYTGVLVIQECCNCHISFAIPQDLHDQLVARGPKESFYCPRGHGQHFTVGEVSRLQDKLARSEEQRQRALVSMQAARDQARAAERSKAAIQGHLTRARKRIGKGACPCCDKHFANVERHMQSQHPDYAEGAGQ